MNELAKKINIESDLLVGCRNRMCVTDDEKELAQLYFGLTFHAINLYRLNIRRISNDL